MSTADDTQLAVAAVYSRALLALARERGEEDALLDELTQVADYLARTPAFIDFLGSPLVDGDARQQVIEKAFRGRASDLLVDGLQVLNRKERLGLLAAVAPTAVLDTEVVVLDDQGRSSFSLLQPRFGVGTSAEAAARARTAPATSASA